MTNALEQACAAVGGQNSLARRLSTPEKRVSQQRVWSWLHTTHNGVPAEYVLAVEKVSGVSRHLLRPDIYPVSEAA